MAPVLHFHKLLAIPASIPRLSGHQQIEKENSHKFHFPPKNSSLSELQGRLEEVEVQGKQDF